LKVVHFVLSAKMLRFNKDSMPANHVYTVVELSHSAFILTLLVLTPTRCIWLNLNNKSLNLPQL